MNRPVIAVPIKRIGSADAALVTDYVAVEEPLSIWLNGRSVAITMRTPGNDEELALGFLFNEGVLKRESDIAETAADGRGNVTVTTTKDVELANLTSREFYVTSSCGVCGKASIEALRESGCEAVAPLTTELTHSVVATLPDKLRQAQAAFEHTGGLHAAGLFDLQANLLIVREDVGRHNAVDKIVGAALRARQMPLANRILMLSGRISFELVQKAAMAGIPVVVAIGAPSSLAVETALRFGMTLIGFLRHGRCNLYAGKLAESDEL